MIPFISGLRRTVCQPTEWDVSGSFSIPRWMNGLSPEGPPIPPPTRRRIDVYAGAGKSAIIQGGVSSNFFHRVAEHAAKAFLDSRKATQVIIGGPGPTKNDFCKGDYLNYQLKNAVIKLVDTQSACNEGIREMFEKSNQELINVCGPEEKRTMERLSVELNKQEGLAITGLDPVLDGLKKGSVEVALVSDSSDLIEAGLTCKKCGLLKTQIINKKDPAALQAIISTPCKRCHAVEYELVEKDMVDVLEDAASLTDARVEVIFTESDEKTKLKALGGFAALLRYKSG